MKYFESKVNPIGELLCGFPKEQTSFTVTMFMDFMKTLATGGLVIETEEECYHCLKELESMKLLSIEWDSSNRPLTITRIMG